MIVDKYKLPNDNVLIWLGTGKGWAESGGIDNVLVLAGGDVLFLKTIKELPLNQKEVREDIKNLSHNKFVEKYEMPTDGGLWSELKKNVKMGKYPPHLASREERIRDYKNMLWMYIMNIVDSHLEPEEQIQELKEIIKDCNMRIIGIKHKSK